jgi:NADH dehydrogenase FAD-containing subunit
MNKIFINKLFLACRKHFSTNLTRHSKLIVIGAGTGGLSVVNQLNNQKIINASDITIFDPAKNHFYQPGFTKIAGGVIESDYLINHWVKYDMKELTSNFNFKNDAVKAIDPEKNSIQTENGDTWTYDHLVIASGLKLNKDSIPGKKYLIDF